MRETGEEKFIILDVRAVGRVCFLNADRSALIVFALTVLGLGVLVLLFVIVKLLFL